MYTIFIIFELLVLSYFLFFSYLKIDKSEVKHVCYKIQKKASEVKNEYDL